MVEKSQAEFLGLEKREIKILQSLKEKPKSMFVLSDDVHIPRATLYPIITKLSDRGFIFTQRIGKRVVYQATPAHELIARLTLIIKDIEWNQGQSHSVSNTTAQINPEVKSSETKPDQHPNQHPEIISPKKPEPAFLPQKKVKKWFGGLFSKK